MNFKTFAIALLVAVMIVPFPIGNWGVQEATAQGLVEFNYMLYLAMNLDTGQCVLAGVVAPTDQKLPDDATPKVGQSCDDALKAVNAFRSNDLPLDIRELGVIKDGKNVLTVVGIVMPNF